MKDSAGAIQAIPHGTRGNATMAQKRRRKSDLSIVDVFGAWGIVALLVIGLLTISMIKPLG
jgi:hypothetical protein